MTIAQRIDLLRRTGHSLQSIAATLNLAPADVAAAFADPGATIVDPSEHRTVVERDDIVLPQGWTPDEPEATSLGGMVVAIIHMPVGGVLNYPHFYLKTSGGIGTSDHIYLGLYDFTGSLVANANLDLDLTLYAFGDESFGGLTLLQPLSTLAFPSLDQLGSDNFAYPANAGYPENLYYPPLYLILSASQPLEEEVTIDRLHFSYEGTSPFGGAVTLDRTCRVARANVTGVVEQLEVPRISEVDILELSYAPRSWVAGGRYSTYEDGGLTSIYAMIEEAESPFSPYLPAAVQMGVEEPDWPQAPEAFDYADWTGVMVPYVSWAPETAYTDDYIIAGGWLFRAQSPGTSGTDEPDWASVDSSIFDGSVTWDRAAPVVLWSERAASPLAITEDGSNYFVPGILPSVPSGFLWRSESSNIGMLVAGDSEPDWASVTDTSYVSDGGILWYAGDQGGDSAVIGLEPGAEGQDLLIVQASDSYYNVRLFEFTALSEGLGAGYVVPENARIEGHFGGDLFLSKALNYHDGRWWYNSSL